MFIEVQNSKIQLGVEQINQNISSPMHMHSYAEIHIILDGAVSFKTENTEITLKTAEAVIFPENTYHSDEGIGFSLAFQVKESFKKIKVIKIPRDFCLDLYNKSKNKENILNHLFFIINEFYDNVKISPCKSDYAYIISEFLSLNYDKNITLKDIADALSLCPMQAQRVIKKHTGKTFGENLLSQRMTVAEQLKKTKSLNEVAILVGYNSYSGFWKAYKKYKR